MTKHTYLRSLQLDAGGWGCWGVTEVSSVILTAETSFGLSLPARGTRRREEEEEKKVRLIFERKDSAIGAVRAQVASVRSPKRHTRPWSIKNTRRKLASPGMLA